MFSHRMNYPSIILFGCLDGNSNNVTKHGIQILAQIIIIMTHCLLNVDLASHYSCMYTFHQIGFGFCVLRRLNIFLLFFVSQK